MTKQIYTLRDNTVEVYNQPFYTFSKEQAERDMLYMANDKDHNIGKNPEQYALYHLGEYDDSTGKFNLNDAPLHVVNLADLRKD